MSTTSDTAVVLRMELSFGRALFGTRYAADPKECADLLDEAVSVMQERADRFAGLQRSHTPMVDDPFVLVLVDEVAFLTAYQSDKGLRQRITAALATLTTQGRAFGVGVMAALQDPRKEVMNIRNLFPDKIALRLDESEQVDMVLGDGARDRGALADRISPIPGTRRRYRLCPAGDLPRSRTDPGGPRLRCRHSADGHRVRQRGRPLMLPSLTLVDEPVQTEARVFVRLHIGRLNPIAARGDVDAERLCSEAVLPGLIESYIGSRQGCIQENQWTGDLKDRPRFPSSIRHRPQRPNDIDSGIGVHPLHERVHIRQESSCGRVVSEDERLGVSAERNHVDKVDGAGAFVIPLVAGPPSHRTRLYEGQGPSHRLRPDHPCESPRPTRSPVSAQMRSHASQGGKCSRWSA
ncbi:UNVERIFIED_ORG: hypothetical protein FHR35_004779 [Microbispora rosea subsp. rosea]